MPMTRAQSPHRPGGKEKSSKWNPFHKKHEEETASNSRDSGYGSTLQSNSDTSFTGNNGRGDVMHSSASNTSAYSGASQAQPQPSTQVQETQYDPATGQSTTVTTTTTTTTTTITTSGPGGTHTVQVPTSEAAQVQQATNSSNTINTAQQPAPQTQQIQSQPPQQNYELQNDARQYAQQPQPPIMQPQNLNTTQNPQPSFSLPQSQSTSQSYQAPFSPDSYGIPPTSQPSSSQSQPYSTTQQSQDSHPLKSHPFHEQDQIVSPISAHDPNRFNFTDGRPPQTRSTSRPRGVNEGTNSARQNPNFSYPVRQQLPSTVVPQSQPNPGSEPQPGPYQRGSNAAAQQTPSSHVPSTLSHAPSTTTSISENRSTLSNLKSVALGIQGASEVLRGSLNYAIDKNTHTDPAILERERTLIQEGKAKIDPIYLDKLNDKLSGSTLGSILAGVSRKPVGPSSAGGGTAAHPQLSELE